MKLSPQLSSSSGPHSLALAGLTWRFCSFMAMPMFPEIFSFPWKNAWEDETWTSVTWNDD